MNKTKQLIAKTRSNRSNIFKQLLKSTTYLRVSCYNVTTQHKLFKRTLLKYI